MSDAPRRILLIRPSALGDVCRSVPLLVSLRRAYPDATIDWLVQDTFVDAIAHHPALSAVVPFPRAELGRMLRRGRTGATIAYLRDLRAREYDTVIDAQGLFRSGLLGRASGARVRIGHADAREQATLFYTHRVRCDRVHTVERMLALLGALEVGGQASPRRGERPSDLLGGRAGSRACDMRLYTTEQDRAWARDVCDGAHPIVLAPTSRWAAKRWPADRFARLARELGAAYPLVVVGGAGEREQIQPLLCGDGSAVCDLVGKTSIDRLLAIIERAALVVANDSAALHIGVAFDRPLVALFGPTDTSRVGPYGREQDVIQHRLPGDRLDHKDDRGVEMMERITLEEVLSACRARLDADA